MKKNLPLRGNGEENPSPFLFRGRIFFPREGKSAPLGKWTRISSPLLLRGCREDKFCFKGTNILPWGRKIFPCWETGKKILPHFSLMEDYSSLGNKNLPMLLNGEENSSPFLLRGRIFFPREEKSSLMGKWGRKSFPISPKGSR